MKTALVYDRVNKWGGAERLLLVLHEMFPKAPLYTAVYDSKKAPWAKVFPEIKTSFLQKIPFLKDKHELLGTFMPLVFESLSLNDEFDKYDLVISVTSEAAKGIITKPHTKHICICLSPTRYLWSHHDLYFKNPLLKLFSRPAVFHLRKWDKIAAQRPDKMIAISSAVQKRIRKYYGRESDVIYPPVSLETSKKTTKPRKNYYLVASRLVPYKRVDLAIKTFNKIGKKLVIVGKGSQEKKLKRMAKTNIDFTNELEDNKLIDHYKNTRALIFPQEEDFGLTSVEAQSFGTPVIAFKKGGAIDTVVEGKTGIFFKRQTVNSLIKAINEFENTSFSDKSIRKNAQRFKKEKFKTQILDLVMKKD